MCSTFVPLQVVQTFGLLQPFALQICAFIFARLEKLFNVKDPKAKVIMARVAWRCTDRVDKTISHDWPWLWHVLLLVVPKDLGKAMRKASMMKSKTSKRQARFDNTLGPVARPILVISKWRLMTAIRT